MVMMFPVLIIVVALPIAWLVSEFRTTKRSIRCTLGILAILSCFGVAWATAQLVRLDYNSWYGIASKRLLDATVEKLESGESQAVIKELKVMQEQFRPTYENRAHFDQLAEETAKRIKAEKPANKSMQATPKGAPDG